MHNKRISAKWKRVGVLMPRPPLNKEKLVETAIKLFSSKGYEATSVRDIAAAMDMTVYNIYHYFGSKEGLLRAILKHHAQLLLDRLREVASHDMDPLERFILLLRIHLHVVGTCPLENKIFLLDNERHSLEGIEENRQVQREILDIDTGGTFTDGFFVSEDKVVTVKVPTTPHELTVCFHECIKAGAERLGLEPEKLLYRTDIVRFSNTIGTNAIIQRNGSKIGLLVTAGMEVKEMTHDSAGVSPLVFSDMVMGLDEEVTESGQVLRSPDEWGTLAAAQALIDRAPAA